MKGGSVVGPAVHIRTLASIFVCIRVARACSLYEHLYIPIRIYYKHEYINKLLLHNLNSIYCIFKNIDEHK